MNELILQQIICHSFWSFIYMKKTPSSIHPESTKYDIPTPSIWGNLLAITGTSTGHNKMYSFIPYLKSSLFWDWQFNLPRLRQHLLTFILFCASRLSLGPQIWIVFFIASSGTYPRPLDLTHGLVTCPNRGKCSTFKWYLVNFSINFNPIDVWK